MLMSLRTSMVGNLHVLTLTPFYPSSRDGSSGCFVSEPLDWLARGGVHNTIFAMQPIYRRRLRDCGSAVRAEWFRYFALPGNLGLSTAGAFAFARMVSRLRKLHHEQPINLIHAHGALPCGHAAMLLSRELSVPFVVSVHGLDAFSSVQVGGRSGDFCRRISRRTYAASRRVICVSEHVREKVIEGMGTNCRTSVVYNGVDPDVFSPGEGHPGGAPILLSVGNLIPTKGHDLLIRSVASLVSDIPSLSLEIIGDGRERSGLDALASQLQIRDRVRFLGRQSRQHVLAAMRRCTVFVLPSRFEGLGCVYLEAMSVGKPVIGCREQGIAEIIQQGSNGFLVGPNNERELTVALEMLIRDENRRRNVGGAARETILDRLTLEQQAENLVRIYRESAA